ncbi:unnamed protein product (macronuclear) [Paramecium tetraurelia]|uniref:Protein kinase domain-containing protein n=1 Tax=Paramecium tetraurelia TaxID=5888 RepID=A0BU92_PARTE|nr:uncharacterized protein GSPATT00032341001 [Paramecium tetraurelia]CAK62109.1 unnamed protein product [Paramecium tetraurelia]|eukprot:XP_001429507.1 hypothetical protein (macronuclear) [Paramecium tetraurelia strain d4-2]
MLQGKQIGDFKLLDELGKGSFGCVYKCQNIFDQSYHAIKIIQFASLNNSEGIVGELLKDEISVLAKIDSPNVLKLEHYFQSKSNCYILMEYCNAGDLEKYWEKKGKRLQEQKVIDIIIQVLSGLSELHKFNIIHRDIKLANILMHNDQVKIADLGFCKQLQNKDMEVTLCLGTIGTMAPEVARYDSYGLQSDIFSIGCIFYQLLFGELPFDCSDVKVYLSAIRQQKIEFYKYGVVIQNEIKEVISKMLKEDPKERLTFPQLFQYSMFTKIQNMSKVSQIAQKNVSKIETSRYYQDDGMSVLKQNEDVFKTQQNQQSQYVESLQKVNIINNTYQNQENVSKLAYELRATQSLSQNQQPIQNTLEQLKEKETVFKTDRTYNSIQIKSQINNTNSLVNTKIQQKYLYLQDALQFCNRTYSEINQIQFENESKSLIGKFMLLKRIRSESKSYLQDLANYPELQGLKGAFLAYIQDSEFYNVLNQIRGNQNLFANLRQEYNNELQEQATGVFQYSYCQALMELHTQIKQEINKQAENKKKKDLVIVLLHIQKCMHFQDLCQEKIEIEEEFFNIKKKNLIDIIKQVQF